MVMAQDEVMTDDEDFIAFVSARLPSLYRLAWLLTGGQQTAEDVLQLALEKSYVKWGRIRQMGAPEAYVRRAVANTAISESRRSFLRHEVNREELPEPPTGSFEVGSDSRSLLWPLGIEGCSGVPRCGRLRPHGSSRESHPPMPQ